MPETTSTAALLKNADESKSAAGGASRPKIQVKGYHLIEAQSVFQKLSDHPETPDTLLGIFEFKVLDSTSPDVEGEYGWKGNLSRRFGKDYPDRNRYKKLLVTLYNEIPEEDRPSTLKEFFEIVDEDSDCVEGLTCVLESSDVRHGKNGDYCLYDFHASSTWDADDDDEDDEDED